ncbi:MAG: leucine-rich repeat domain-containing protein [Bacteroidaceae bacterium]|nr:leucine-rich repeat domain-containing protein [Bacteroidaceae bacterium]
MQNIISVFIPRTVTIINKGAFSGCSKLKSIIVDENNQNYDSRNNCNAIIETRSNTLIAGCMNTFIPNSVVSIGDCAFCGCVYIESLDIPNSVIRIEENAFTNCFKLSQIKLPSNLTHIGDGAFAGCTGLFKIISYIPENKLFTTEEDAFLGVDYTKCTLFVPSGAISKYSTTSSWNHFTNIVTYE